MIAIRELVRLFSEIAFDLIGICFLVWLLSQFIDWSTDRMLRCLKLQKRCIQFLVYYKPICRWLQENKPHAGGTE